MLEKIRFASNSSTRTSVTLPKKMMTRTIGNSSSPPIRHTTSLLTNTLKCDFRHSCTGASFAAILWLPGAARNHMFDSNEKSKSRTNAAARQRLVEFQHRLVVYLSIVAEKKPSRYVASVVLCFRRARVSRPLTP